MKKSLSRALFGLAFCLCAPRLAGSENVPGLGAAFGSASAAAQRFAQRPADALRVTLINYFDEPVAVRLFGVWTWVEARSCGSWVQSAEGRMDFWIIAPTLNPPYSLARDPDGTAHLTLTFRKPDRPQPSISPPGG